jgi:hypothetical protein
MTVVFGGEIIQRLFNHGAMVFLEDFSVGFSAEHFPAFMLKWKSLTDGPPIPTGSPISLPSSVFVLVQPFPEFFVGHGLSSCRRRWDRSRTTILCQV